MKKCDCCAKPAKWASRKLWGSGSTLYLCDAHKPGAGRENLSASLRAKLEAMPSFYETVPLPVESA